MGAVAMVGIFVPFWALGGCFRFIAWLGMLLIGAIGTGALIVPWLNQRNQLAEKSSASGVVDADVTPVESATEAPPVTAEESSDNTVTVHRAEAPAPEAPASKNGADDFTRINGIGAVFQQRLNAAGIRTFAQLAAMMPEQIADVIGWPTARVVQAQIVAQAQWLADGE